MSSLRDKHKALVSRILDGDGSASRADRRSAFDDAGLKGPMKSLISQVATHAHSVTDADITAVRASGVSEDHIFEMVVSAAIGQATRQYNMALSALDLATEKE
jgi:hypothetical protein